MKKRTELNEMLELCGRFLAIDGIEKLMKEYENGISNVKANGITMQIMGLGMKTDPALMTDLIIHNKGVSAEEVDAMSDKEYSQALKTAIMGDILGFFA